MIRLLLVLPFVGLGLYAVYAAFKYTRMISNIFMELVYEPSLPPSDQVRGEQISILDSADREIPALVAENPSASRTVIFCHESGANKGSWEKYTHFLLDHGCRVLSIDFDEKPRSPQVNSLTQWPDENDVERLLTAARWAKKAYPSSSAFVLFGVSKGANVALAASGRIESPCAVVADGLFSMKEIFRDYIRKWGPVLVKPNLFGEHYPDWIVDIFTELGFWHCQHRSKKKFIDVEKLLRQKHAPLLMIHGETDDYVPSSHQSFLQRLNPPARAGSHWVAPQAGHNEAVELDKERYQKQVTDFLKKVLIP